MLLMKHLLYNTDLELLMKKTNFNKGSLAKLRECDIVSKEYCDEYGAGVILDPFPVLGEFYRTIYWIKEQRSRAVHLDDVEIIYESK